ncbi:translocation/assembly module TamB domain-containing protein [Flavobacterium sp. 3HN19-14]|uniref:translocation/assembly module TamB domain-containing protein n=1 Tax=Flavobacterium sp. 3HN19-14 TaxID=3448133 RepID=UPI003EDF5149
MEPEVTAKINTLSFKDHRGLFVKDLNAKFTYTKQNILLDDLTVQTKYSTIKGNVGLYYDRKDFKDFNNKVVFKVGIDASTIATNDIRYFYKELGRNKVFNLSSKISGTLNNLTLKNFKIDDNKRSYIAGELNFKNLFDTKTKPFYMKAKFDRLDSNYDDAVSILPNILGKKLPVVLKKLGQYNLTGTSEVTTTYLKSDFFLTSAIGNVLSTLKIDNIGDINNASYSGNVVLENFNIGNFLDRNDVGIVSLDLNVDGKGFTSKNLDTKIDGKIFRLGYNKYNYSNIVVNGGLKSPYYNGKLVVNDPNLFMDFDGILDLSKKDTRYDFHANIDFANLNKLNFTKDSIAIFKGEIRSDVSGNSLDNLSGTVTVADASYQNQKDTYIFDDFSITSNFDADRVRTIAINSPNIIDGQVVGKFQFSELGKMVQNSIGSLYTNYKPNKVKKGQYLKFNFSVYNKIIEIFYPGIEIATNTFIRGNINSDNDEFKLSFTSPNIKAYENNFDNIRISVDNKNPLYNAYIELDSVRTKYYKLADFSLINVTMKDTMFVRSEFKGGKKSSDFYKLNFFHTIDKDNNNVVGIKKSELKFKDYLWFLNEKGTDDNKIVFDKKFKNFNIDNIIMSHENQKIELLGTLKDSTYKDLNLNFANVDLSQIIPIIDSLKIAGNLKGKVNFKQNNNIYQPTSSLKIDGLNVNNIVLGDLSLDVAGDNSFRNFTVSSSLANDNVESFLAEGTFRIENKRTLMDMDLRFNEFNLAALSPLGGNVISNIRGYISGASYISGTIDKPDINGRLFLEQAGFGIPYLNTDYSFRENSIVDLSESQFLFQNATIVDTKYKTEGRLNGAIRHKNFSKWDLDLYLSANNLLALDTKDSEDAAYYGTAFIDGNATISGSDERFGY